MKLVGLAPAGKRLAVAGDSVPGGQGGSGAWVEAQLGCAIAGSSCRARQGAHLPRPSQVISPRRRKSPPPQAPASRRGQGGVVGGGRRAGRSLRARSRFVREGQPTVPGRVAKESIQPGRDTGGPGHAEQPKASRLNRAQGVLPVMGGGARPVSVELASGQPCSALAGPLGLDDLRGPHVRSAGRPGS